MRVPHASRRTFMNSRFGNGLGDAILTGPSISSLSIRYSTAQKIRIVNPRNILQAVCCGTSEPKPNKTKQCVKGLPSSYSETRYSYQYDQHGNWTEKTVSYRSSSDAAFQSLNRKPWDGFVKIDGQKVSCVDLEKKEGTTQ
jgi:hypothetical protein